MFRRAWDAIAIYDLEGHLVAGNAVARALVGETLADTLRGTHFSEHLALDVAVRSARSFAECVTSGAIVEGETVFRDAEGTDIPVRMRLVPARLDDTIVGVIGFARDIRHERETARAAKRIDDLYGIAAASSMSSDDKVASALARARAELGANWAYVGRFHDGLMDVTHVDGDPAVGFPVGFTTPLERTIARRACEANDVYVVNDLRRTEYRAMLDGKRASWRSFIGVPLVVNGEPYGAVGFLADRRPFQLSPTDRGYVRAIGTLISSALQQGAREKRLDTLAFHDALTGLPNRALLTDRLERALLAARRNHRSFAVHYVDIDRFKEVNDTYGHHVGDGVLIAVADWLQSNLRDSDTVARIGGDEFVVLQPEIDSNAQAEDVAARVVTIRDQPLHVGELSLAVRLSVGVAVYPADGANPVDMLRAADAQLYTVKNGGRDGYAISTV
jgi:diguanylate cyclase (GGDEF)-like protein/PAS domain S-box-containing protein